MADIIQMNKSVVLWEHNFGNWCCVFATSVQAIKYRKIVQLDVDRTVAWQSLR